MVQMPHSRSGPPYLTNHKHNMKTCCRWGRNRTSDIHYYIRCVYRPVSLCQASSIRKNIAPLCATSLPLFYPSICPVYCVKNWTFFIMKHPSTHGRTRTCNRRSLESAILAPFCYMSNANIGNLYLFHNFIHYFFCYASRSMLEHSHGSLPINLILYLHADL